MTARRRTVGRLRPTPAPRSAESWVGSTRAHQQGMKETSRNVWFRPADARAPVTLTALRIGVGVIMFVHGWTKLSDTGAWSAQVESLGIPLPGLAAGLAIVGETLGGALLALGLLTSVAAFGVLCVMATAIGFVHLGNGLLASNNGMEYPLLIGLLALHFIARGAGPFSLDALIRKRATTRTGTRTEEPQTRPHATGRPASARPASAH